MNIQGLLNTMRREIAAFLSGVGLPKKGVVSSYDPANYCVKVILQPEGTETGWLPLATEWSGNGWGLFAPPDVGDMVDVHFDEGNRQSPYVSKKFYSNARRPLTVPSKEFWLVHSSGSLLKFLNNGDVQLVTNRDLNATIGRDLVAEAARDIKVTADRDLVSTVGRNQSDTVTGNADLTVTGNITSEAADWQHTGNEEIIGLLTAGGLVITGASQPGGAEVNCDISITGKFGCNGEPPQGKVTVNAAATTNTQAIALVNQLRALLIANGQAQ